MKMKFAEFRTMGESAVLVLKRPPLNILNQAMCEELTGFLTRLSQESKFENLEKLLLVSEEKCFSAGADIDEHFPEKVGEMLPKFHELLLTLVSFPIPTVAAISGSCFGGGLELARACDLAIAWNVQEFQLGLPEIKLGCFPPFGLTVLPRLSKDPVRTLEFLLTGETLSIRGPRNFGYASDIGLIDGSFTGSLEELIDDLGPDEIPRIKDRFQEPFFLELGALENFLSSNSDNLSYLSGFALSRAFTALVASGLEKDLMTALKIAEEVYLEELIPHPDYLEGLMAFKEKRVPVWKKTGL